MRSNTPTSSWVKVLKIYYVKKVYKCQTMLYIVIRKM